MYLWDSNTPLSLAISQNETLPSAVVKTSAMQGGLDNFK